MFNTRMKRTHPTSAEELIERALHSASHTRFLSVRGGARHEAADAFESLFGSQKVMVVADENTFSAAGRDVQDSFHRAGHDAARPFVFGPHVDASDSCVQELQAALQTVQAVPVAVGSGTINDLTKLAAHRLNRPYLVVATAASMDGYTAFGASITLNGSKQTFDCSAPKGVLADLDVIAAAPPGMNAAGYADLLAKVAAGADWILADAIGAEAIDPLVWETVQGRLQSWVDSPGAVARNDPAYLRRLIHGLLISGFAMQAYRSSRPASGAEHQFSHLWDMQHHTHNGASPSHGFKVGIGTLASIALYENVLQRSLENIDIDRAIEAWPSQENLEARIISLFGSDELAGTAQEETRAKYPTEGELRAQLTKLRAAWPEVRAKLIGQLIPFADAQSMLEAAGCPHRPEQIGISRDRLRISYEQAACIRRRITVFDIVHRAGVIDMSLGTLFGPGGQWSPKTQTPAVATLAPRSLTVGATE